MFDTKEELLAQIRLGEDSRLELKSVTFKGGRISTPNPNSVADEIVAFANSSGGVIILGVGDKSKKPQGMNVDGSKRDIDESAVQVSGADRHRMGQYRSAHFYG